MVWEVKSAGRHDLPIMHTFCANNTLKCSKVVQPVNNDIKPLTIKFYVK